MTEQHTTAVNVPVYPDEFKVLLKAINRAIESSDFKREEIEYLRSFKEDFVDYALEYAV